MAFTSKDVENIVIEAISRFATGEYNQASEIKVLEWLRRNYTAIEDPNVYYGCTSSAIIAVEHDMHKKGYKIIHDETNLIKHVSLGNSVKYDLPLFNIKKNKVSKLWLHIQLYRMDNGRYELNHYIS